VKTRRSDRTYKSTLPSKAVRHLQLDSKQRLEDYYDHERLDGWRGICKFLGISRSVFYERLRWDMDAAGIIFYRPKKSKVQQQIFTYKRLVMNFMIKRRRI
jgi:hypothetical protein